MQRAGEPAIRALDRSRSASSARPSMRAPPAAGIDVALGRGNYRRGTAFGALPRRPRPRRRARRSRGGSAGTRAAGTAACARAARSARAGAAAPSRRACGDRPRRAGSGAISGRTDQPHAGELADERARRARRRAAARGGARPRRERDLVLRARRVRGDAALELERDARRARRAGRAARSARAVASSPSAITTAPRRSTNTSPRREPSAE